MFLISSLFYLFSPGKYGVSTIDRKDELRIDSKKYISVDSKITYKVLSPKDKDLSSIATGLVEDNYYAILYEKTIKASVNQLGLQEIVKYLPNEIKSQLNVGFEDQGLNIIVTNIKMNIKMGE